MLLETDQYTDYALLFLRLIIAILLFSRKKGLVTNPKERGKSGDMSKSMVFLLGIIEMITAISLTFGIFTQIGAGLIIVSMLGAIYMKIYVWNTELY